MSAARSPSESTSPASGRACVPVVGMVSASGVLGAVSVRGAWALTVGGGVRSISRREAGWDGWR